MILANLVGLGGCAITKEQAKVQMPVVARTTTPTPSQTEAQAALQRRITVCRSRYPAGYPHFLDKAHCDEAARRAALLASGTPADLADAYLATRADVAGRLDRGEITREQAEHELAKVAAETNEQTQVRHRGGVTAPGVVGVVVPGVVTSALRLPPDARPLPPPVPIQPGVPW